MASCALEHLVGCAQAIRDGNLQVAASLLEQIWKLADDESHEGQSEAVRYFVEALVRRAYGLRSASPYVTSRVPPFLRYSPQRDCFAEIVIDAIIKAAMGKKQLHIIAFDTSESLGIHNFLWPLSAGYGVSMSVRVSLILPTIFEKTNFVQNRKSHFDWIANKVHQEDLKIVYANTLGEVDASTLDFRRTKDEAVVICYWFKLHELLAETGALEREFLKLRDINPETVIIAEQDADHNNSDFIKRLEDSFQYYSNVSSRRGIFAEEKNAFRRQIHNIVGSEGRDRIVRHQTLAQWQSHFQSAGFLPFPLEFSEFIVDGMIQGTQKQNGSALLTLNNCPFRFLSAWKLTDKESHLNPTNNNFVEDKESYLNPTNNNFVEGFDTSPPLENMVQPFQFFPEGLWLNQLAALTEIYDMLEEICCKYKLRGAITWLCRANVNEKRTLFIQSTFCYPGIYAWLFPESIKACEKQQLLEGQAVAGKALRSKKDFHFESSVAKLKKRGQPFAEIYEYIRGSDAAMAICLRNSSTMDVDYVVEFIVPKFERKPENKKSLAFCIFNDLKNMKKVFVTVGVRGTEVQFQEKDISNIRQRTMPTRNPPPASSTDYLQHSNTRGGDETKKQGLNEQEEVIPKFQRNQSASSQPATGGALETPRPHGQGNEKHADGNNSLTSSDKKRKNMSFVWKHFTKEDGGGRVCAICNYCGKEFDGSSIKGTTHLRNHLNHCSKIPTELRDQQLKRPIGRGDSKTESASESNSSFDQDRSNMDVARMVINWQLNIVEDESFISFAKNLQPMFKLQSLGALSPYIVRVYEEEEHKLLNDFGKFSCRFNLIISLWAHDLEKTTYCCYAVQFIDENWKLKKKILALKSLRNQFDKSIFYESFQKFLSEWKINKKVCSLTLHNSSSCFEIAEEIRRNWDRFVDSHPSSTFYFSSDLLCKDNSGENAAKCVDGVTRTSNACLQDILYSYRVSSQQEGRVYPLMNVISDNKWGTCSLVLAIAAILDPRFKLRFVEFSYNKIYGNDAAKIHLKKIHDVFTGICLEYASNMCGKTLFFDDTNSSTLLNHEEDIMESFYSCSEKFTFTEASWKELAKYVDQEPIKPYNSEVDILGWWCEQASSFPILGRMVRDILAIPLSSIISGSFTEKDMLDNPIFSGLSIDIIEAMLCSRDWMDSPQENDRANRAPLQNKAKRKMEEKETTAVKSCKIQNYGETSGGDKSKASCKKIGCLSVENVQQEGRPLKLSEPNHERDISGLVEISDGDPSFDNQSEFQCSSSESDGEIACRVHGAWNEKDVQAYLVSSFTEKEKKRLKRWQSHKPIGKHIGRDKRLCVEDGKLRPLLIIPDGVETRQHYYIGDEVVNTFFRLLKKRSDRFPETYINHYSFDSQIATQLIKGPRSKDEVFSSFKKEKLRGVHKIFLPVCLHAHWVLFYVDTEEKKFYWLDPKENTRESNHDKKEAILHWFKKFLLPTFGYEADEWPFQRPTNIPAQKNGVDCGVFVMKYADCLTHGNFFPFQQEDMAHFRHRTFLDIYRGRLHSHK